MKQPKVLILYTGGTFGMTYQKGPKNQPALLSIPKHSPSLLKKRLLKHVPELQDLAQCHVEVVLNRDSAHIGPSEWVLLAREIQTRWKDYEGLVILHGTDTLPFTASALSFLLRPCLKPVILTGAQRPLVALRNDARMNLISSVEIAAQGPRDRVNRVSVFFGDQLFQGNRVRKKSASDYSAFESPRFPPLALVGTTIRYAEPMPDSPEVQLSLEHRFSEKVLMCHLTPGFNAKALMALPPKTIAKKTIEGLVLVAFPSGTGPTHSKDLLRLLKHFREREIPVVITTEGSTQPPSQVLSGIAYEAGISFGSSGCFSAGSMTPECAFVKTSWLLGQSTDLKLFADRWKLNFAREG